MSLKRRIAVVLAGVLAVCAAALAGGWLYLRSALPVYDGEVRLSGLSAPVEVRRDAYGIPWIQAQSEADLVRAVGYVHAQDRLWQMELYRRIAEGRLAELFGRELVDADRFLRTVGLGRAAAEEEKHLGAEERALLQAYADGVNAYVASHPGALPPELVLLRLTPEPWTIRSSLDISKLMAWNLTTWEEELGLQELANTVRPELLREVEQSFPDWGPHVLEGGAQWKSRPGGAPSGSGPREAGPRVALPDDTLGLAGLASIARASNAWVLDGRRTRSGKPLLANDMHLPLQAPAQWYLAALRGGGIEAAGMTLPGLPFVVVGHSHRVAWGFTASMVDDVDFFVEKLDPQDPSRYLTADGPRPFEVRTERIGVKSGEPVSLTVRSTQHGPLISDVLARTGERTLAVLWAGTAPSQNTAALMRANRARSAAELVSAMRGFGSPTLDMIYADADGRVGMKLIGKVPVRAKGDGVFAAPGWEPEQGWIRTLDFDELPGAVDPAAGALFSANNRIVGPEYPYLLTQIWPDPYRAVRIEQLLKDRQGLTVADASQMQLDIRDGRALRHQSRAVRCAELAGAPAAAAELRAWDGEARADSHAAALFYTWYHAFRPLLSEDEIGDRHFSLPLYAEDRILDSGDSAWVDDVRTPKRETFDELCSQAMVKALQTVQQKTWGELHATLLPHIMGSNALLDRLFGLNVGPFSSGGSPSTVAMSAFKQDAPPFVSSYGPSQRHVVDLADPDGTGGFVLPSGQCGVPFSPHYRDQTPLYQRGELIPVPLDPEKARARSVHTLVLR